ADIREVAQQRGLPRAGAADEGDRALPVQIGPRDARLWALAGEARRDERIDEPQVLVHARGQVLELALERAQVALEGDVGAGRAGFELAWPLREQAIEQCDLGVSRVRVAHRLYEPPGQTTLCGATQKLVPDLERRPVSAPDGERVDPVLLDEPQRV